MYQKCIISQSICDLPEFANSDQIKCHLHIHVCEIILKLIVYVKYFFHIRMWGLGLSFYVMFGTTLFIILLLVYMVGSVVFGQFRQLQKNQTKSMIHPSLTCPPWRHVVWINRLRYIQLPAQTSIGSVQCMHWFFATLTFGWCFSAVCSSAFASRATCHLKVEIRSHWCVLLQHH